MSGRLHNVGPAQRRRVLERDNFTCVDCGAYDPTRTGAELEIDHVIEINEGKHLDASALEYLASDANLRTRCEECHARKTARYATQRARLQSVKETTREHRKSATGRLCGEKRQRKGTIPSRPFGKRVKEPRS